MKGKTWGPSTVHQKERAHIRPVVHVNGQHQWSRSAPNLEKTQKGLMAAASAGVPQIGQSSSGLTSSTCTDSGDLDNIFFLMTLIYLVTF